MSGDKENPRVEPGIGRSLESARESRGLSLWQVEQETRIRSRYLRDLEREDFDVLPAVYVLGSLKTYADFLGLDGAALSRQLKDRLAEPAEPEVPPQLAALGGTRDEDDEYEAVPVPAVGFDQLFLGMGVILISILAVMTLVAAVAQGDESPVSQVNEPSTPETPSEIALAGNVQDAGNAKKDADGVRSTNEDKEDRPEEGPESPKPGEDGKDQDDGEAQDEPQTASPFDGVDFAPMSPSSSTTASASAASASASPAPSSPTPSSPAPSSPTPSSPAPAATGPDDSPSSPAPAVAGASPVPVDNNPGVASAPADAPAAAPAGPEGGGGSSPQATEPDAGPISAEVDRIIDEAFQRNGLDR